MRLRSREGIYDGRVDPQMAWRIILIGLWGDMVWVCPRVTMAGLTVRY